MNLYRIELNNGDWWLWFAKSKRDAITGLSDLTTGGFRLLDFLISKEPRTKQLLLDEKVSCLCEKMNGDSNIITRTVEEWCAVNEFGPWQSNTYEVES